MGETVTPIQTWAFRVYRAQTNMDTGLNLKCESLAATQKFQRNGLVPGGFQVVFKVGGFRQRAPSSWRRISFCSIPA